MKKIAITLAAVVIAASIQMTSFASSGLSLIPSVSSLDDFAVDYGRDIDSVLAGIEASAKAELGITDGGNVAPKPVKPEEIKEEEPKPEEPSYYYPSNYESYFGDEVRLQILNGLPMIFLK